MDYHSKFLRIWLVFFLAFLSWPNYAQQEQAPTPLYSKAELEQLVAPIALYPDSLIAQILMASTYPLEVVTAARWVDENPNLKEQQLEDALQKQPWDPSVKSLTAVPEVLKMMNDKLEFTEKLGNAFLAQQKDVMDAIQTLRAKAQTAGNLKTTPQQVVKKNKARASKQVQGTSQIATPPNYIVIEQVNPQIIYVPTYDPSYIYGGWAYADYPPYYYYPSGYVAGSALLSFGAGILVGNALWGDFDWHHGDIDINVNRYNSFNRTHVEHFNNIDGRNVWEHNPAHRQGLDYPNQFTQQRFDKNQLQRSQTRDAFRGKAETGRQQLKEHGAAGLNRDLQRGNKGTRQADRAKQGQRHQGAKKQTQQRQKSAKANQHRQHAGKSSQHRQQAGRSNQHRQGSRHTQQRRSVQSHRSHGSSQRFQQSRRSVQHMSRGRSFGGGHRGGFSRGGGGRGGFGGGRGGRRR